MLLFRAFAAFLGTVNKCLIRNNLEGFALALVLGPSVMAGKTVTEAPGHAVSAVRRNETPSAGLSCFSFLFSPEPQLKT